MSLLSDDDLHWFNEGTHSGAWEKLGAHPGARNGTAGTHFAVWAPNARAVSVIGDFNQWTKAAHRLRPRGTSGIWETFVPRVGAGALYKYHIVSRVGTQSGDKADPFGFQHQIPPLTASVVTQLDYDWGDAAWMAERGARNGGRAPISIYEIHLGSWRRVRGEGHRSLSYREVAEPLAEYLLKMGFTHVEMLPVMEHPFFGSWGYQITGFFAPSARYGSPQDLMFLIDTLHQHGIGVILDWVPSHFPTDAHGLAFFDGTHLFEHGDPRIGFHQDWKSYIFDYGRPEVRSFLLSSALFWLRQYHADALRVDAVASMLYRDYSRKAGEWVPNRYGGRENLEAIDFLRQLNIEVYRVAPSVQVIAEESTAWPMVSRPVYVGGLGFGMKWDMGWMHDTLAYFGRDPIHRAWHHNQITFRMMYAFSENFVLPLSHDEVVHGKGSLIGRMPGDAWRKFANLRVMLAYMFTQPGKKLLFMGGEFGQVREWNHDDALDWHLLDTPLHAGLQHFVADLNALYRRSRAAHELDFENAGFEWINADDHRNSVLTYVRRSTGQERLLVVLNLTPLIRTGYRVGVPFEGTWTEILNSDAEVYGGSGAGNYGAVATEPEPWHGRPCSLVLTVPPLSALILEALAPPDAPDQPADAESPAPAEPGA